MTDILQVITEYCAIYVDDDRLQELAISDPALYARKMWGYLKPAISLFKRPPEMEKYLVGTSENPKLVEPTYDNTTVVVEDMQTSDYAIQLCDMYDYDLCVCRVKSLDNVGNVVLTPFPCTYYPEQSSVVLHATTENPLNDGAVLDFDFYADGYFANELDGDMMNILGLCFQVVWQNRFNQDWLSMVDKLEDKSFTTQNRANKIKSDSDRLIMLRHQLYDEMQAYEQKLMYNTTVNNKLKV